MNRMIEKRVVWGFVVTCLCACAPLPAYKPDLAGKPTARIRLVSIHPSGAYPRQLSGGACVPGRWTGGPMVEGQGYTPSLHGIPRPNHPEDIRREGIGIPMTGIPRSANFTEHKIVAESPIVFEFHTVYQERFGATKSCTTGIAFTPKEGADYEAIFSQIDQGCKVSLVRLRLNPAGRVLEEPAPDAKGAPRCKSLLGQDIQG